MSMLTATRPMQLVLRARTARPPLLPLALAAAFSAAACTGSAVDQAPRGALHAPEPAPPTTAPPTPEPARSAPALPAPELYSAGLFTTGAWDFGKRPRKSVEI